MVQHERSGLLVSAGDPEELATAMLRALTSDDASSWGKEGALLVKQNFGLERMVAAYEDLYRNVLDV